MRKLIILALSLFLVSIFASPGIAETKIKFSGFYKIFHENNVNFERHASNSQHDNESYFWHRLQLLVDFTPTDDINIRWVLRGPNTVRWGQIPYGDASGANAGRHLDLFTRAIYATINTDYGKFVVGRHNGSMVGNIAGLETLGYNQKYGDFLAVHVFDWNLPFDGITYTKNWDNGFGIHVLYVKERSENSITSFYDSDNDADRFGIEPYYKWDGGGVSLLISYLRDKSATSSYQLSSNYVYPVRDNWQFFLNPALILSWGSFTLHFEGKVAWGETEYRRAINAPGAPVLEKNKVKDSGLGLYVDGVYNYGPGAVTLAGWFIDGNDLDEGGPAPGRKKGHGLVGGGSFSPFLVAYGSVIGLGNGSRVNVLGDTSPNGRGVNKYKVNNHWAIAILGDHNFTKDVKFHWGLGYFRSVNARGRHLIGYDSNLDPIFANNSKDLGFEVDVGLIAKLLDNLSFESHFGYFKNGAAFKRYDAVTPGPGKKAKDTYAWANALIFTF
jgi:hypothetical protein